MARDEGDEVTVRPEIRQSWRRSELHGVGQDSVVSVVVRDVNRGSRLMAAAQPVLDHLMTEIGSEPVSLMLADRECRVVYQRSGARFLGASLESNGVLPGATLDEGVAGTNGLGTPFELGRSVAINGDEHYLNALKGFSCFGHPIRHPLTGRIEGVLDLTFVAARPGDTHGLGPLVAPLVAHAAHDIETRLLEGSRAAERRMFLAFQSAVRKRSAPVAVLGGDVVLANRSCLDRLGSQSPTVLRVLLADLGTRSRMTQQLDLGSAGRFWVDTERIDGTPDGVLFRLDESVETPGGRPRASTPVRSRGPFVVAGEPGTGRTHEADRLVGSASADRFDTLDAVVGDAGEWLSRVVAAAARPGGLIVENVEALDDTSCAVLRRALATSPRIPIVLTSAPLAELSVAVSALVSACTDRIELVPVRERLPELPALIAALASEGDAGPAFTVSAQALEVLAGQPWSGNMAELAQLVGELRARPLAGRVGVDDLPSRYRQRTRSGLSGRQRAERGAIVAALREAGGNKRDAAQELGMSRTTLYRKMREFDIPGTSRG
ncbi:hypothetical protein FDO65_06550 [Nakamurella flava]|uniref:DNA binding HTH domain-containing protein n=1 Tax=Nakamurella flava TaxID=2576308 RepID=A0A4U6QMA4_9ACTN|nr:helix-turn-helix domain-containing protein [Nakamurella flava]TKV61268.1 hypothetical protein FDO65_06550 [Nakamurella flava]